jgi:RNA polymerase primary sigma factor
MSSKYFSNYLVEIGDVPLLPPEREIELSQIIQRGLAPNASTAEFRASENGRTELALHNIRLVVSIARTFAYSSLTLEEMTFAGNVGLMEAAKRFKGESKARFATYAFYWIQATIRVAIRSARLIRTPERRARVLQRIRTAWSFREDQSAQDLDTLHQETGISTEKIKRVLRDQCMIISLDRPMHDDSGEGIEAILPTDEVTPAEIVSHQEVLSELAKAVSLLTPREKHVVCSRFGINTDKIETLKQIGSCYGLSFERIRQIETLALEKLRSSLDMPGGRRAESLDSTGHENKISDTDGYSPV